MNASIEQLLAVILDNNIDKKIVNYTFPDEKKSGFFYRESFAKLQLNWV